MNKDLRWVRYAVGVALLLLAGHVMDIFDSKTTNTLVQALLRGMRSLIHISLLMGWCMTLYQRILNPQVRRDMIILGGLMAFWLTAKVIKWEFVDDRTFWLGRYLWYSYYIPMILIPLKGVFIIDHMGKPEGYRNPEWMKALYIPALAILAGIFTNDLHGLAFSFPNGIELFDYDYGYGIFYFAAMAWFVLLGIYFVVMLLKKSRVPGSKRMQKMPLNIMLGAVGFWTLYCLKIIQSVDLTVCDCVIISLLLESAIQSGMIPSNTNYRELFRTSTIAAQIVDQEHQVCYTSALAMPLTPEEMKRYGTRPTKLGHKILHREPIRGGYVIWQDDVTGLDELTARLQEVQAQLGRENELLQAELKLKEQQIQLEEKRRLYDRIAAEAEPQLQKLEQLLTQLEDPAGERAVLVRMCVIGSHLKRRSNLLLLGEEMPVIPVQEIEYCIRESLDNLRLASVCTMLTSRCEGELAPEAILDAYDFFETLVEKLLDQITALVVHLSCQDGNLRMKLQIGCTDSPEPQLLEGISPRLGSFTHIIEEEDVQIEYETGKGGACA